MPVGTAIGAAEALPRPKPAMPFAPPDTGVLSAHTTRTRALAHWLISC